MTRHKVLNKIDPKVKKWCEQYVDLKERENWKRVSAY